MGQFGPGVLPARVLSERNVPLNQRSFNGRKDRRFQIFFAQQPVHWPCPDSRKEHALRVDPRVSTRVAILVQPVGSAGDKDRPGCAQRNQLVIVDWQVPYTERPGVFHEIPRHPVKLIGRGHIAYLLAIDVPVEFRSGLARRADIADGKARVVRHGHKRCLPISRMTFNSHLLRID